jgi:hypothetical protein
MAADASAYAILGLEPGADAKSVDRAYRDLIKRYHPDRAGGDAMRAAEINRAYLELRGPRSTSRELVLNEDQGWRPVRVGRSAWLALGVALAAASISLVVVSAFAPASGPPRSAQSAAEPRPAPARPGDPMDQPLATAAIEGGMRDALRIARTGDELALAEKSRDCHRRLRSDPTIAQLDRCAAFDDTVVQLQDRDPLRDRGPFSDLVVTRRQISAGALLSNDYLSIDSRLDRIRLRVELALAPPAPPPVVEVPETD